jgi:hypothetical protein
MYQTGLHRIYSNPCVHCGEKKQIGEKFIAGCTRKDCKIEAYFDEPFGEGELLPQFSYLLDIP